MIVAQELPRNGTNGTKWYRNGTKWYKMVQEWSRNGPGMYKEWYRNGTGMAQEGYSAVWQSCKHFTVAPHGARRV